MKKVFFVFILIGLVGCTEEQRDGWAKRVEKISGDQESEVAANDTLNPDNFSLNEQILRSIDLKTAVVQRQMIADVLEVPAVIRPHPNHVISVKAPLPGRVTELHVNQGSTVAKGALLAVIEDPKNLGQRFRVRAPIAGLVRVRPISKDEWVESGDPLMEIVDYRVLRGIIQLYPDEEEKVRTGQVVVFSGNGWTISAKIDFVAPAANPETGTVEARADIVNSSGRIRTNLPVTAAIVLGEKEALVVPVSSLVREDAFDVVFVQQGDRFEKRTVEIGVRHQGLAEVVEGLQEGETVVTHGAYQLKHVAFSATAATVEDD
ncbi:MAG: efflux RND transporter periplasmic adaptor subunit [bacterium]